VKTALAATALAATLALAPGAAADTYTNQVAGKFGPSNHVVADPTAVPALPNPGAINGQILATHKPIYVAAVSAQQNVTPDQLEGALAARTGKFEGVVLVVDRAGYHAKAYNAPANVAATIPGLVNQIAADNHRNVQGAVSEFVSRLAALKAPVAAPAPHRDYSWLWTVLWSVLGLVGAGLVVYATARFVGKRNADKEIARAKAEKIRSEIISLQPRVDALNEAVVISDVSVSSQANTATRELSDAKAALANGAYADANAHLLVVRTQVAAGEKLLNPKINTIYSTPEATRVAGSAAEKASAPSTVHQATVSAKNPSTGKTVIINNNDYRQSSGAGYNNYYGGGWHNGIYFYPGYYAYPFWGVGWGWSPADVLLTEAILHEGYYGHGGYESSTASAGFGDDTKADWNTDDNWSGAQDSSTADASFDTTYSSDTSSSSFDSSDSGSSSWFETPSSSSSYDGSSSSGWDSGSSSSSSSYDSGSSYSSSYDSGSSYSSSYDSGSSYSSSSSGWDSGSSSSSFDSGSSGCGGGSW
jgi:hypothetical protein